MMIALGFIIPDFVSNFNGKQNNICNNNNKNKQFRHIFFTYYVSLVMPIHEKLDGMNAKEKTKRQTNKMQHKMIKKNCEHRLRTLQIHIHTHT